MEVNRIRREITHLDSLAQAFREKAVACRSRDSKVQGQARLGAMLEARCESEFALNGQLKVVLARAVGAWRRVQMLDENVHIDVRPVRCFHFAMVFERVLSGDELQRRADLLAEIPELVEEFQQATRGLKMSI